MWYFKSKTAIFYGIFGQNGHFEPKVEYFISNVNIKILNCRVKKTIFHFRKMFSKKSKFDTENLIFGAKISISGRNTILVIFCEI